MTEQIAIVGAGIAGAAAGLALSEQGKRVTLFERHFCPGGRMATRHSGGAQWDHGAQYFTISDEHFGQACRRWEERGWVAPWHGRLVGLPDGGPPPFDGDRPRYVAQPGMNQLAAHLCEGLDLRCEHKVRALRREADAWWLETSDANDKSSTKNTNGPFDAILLAVTAPQALALLPADPFAEDLSRVAFSPCWAAMLELADAVEYGFDAAFVNDDVLAWVARDSSKPGRIGERWVLHAHGDWSRDQAGQDPAKVASALWKRLASLLQDTLPAPGQAHARLWSQARVAQPLGADCLVDAERGLGVCGDWCLDARVEAAWLSGRAAAAALMQAGD